MARRRWLLAPAAVLAAGVVAGAHLPDGHAAEGSGNVPELVAAALPSQAGPFAAGQSPAGSSPAVAELAVPEMKEAALRIVSSAENSTLDWRSQFGYIQDIHDGRGYTAGIVGFCSGTHDLLTLVERYTAENPSNGLARFLAALRAVDGSASHDGLGPAFEQAWRTESARPEFRRAQEAARDGTYFDPAVRQAKADGLHALGQFAYFDAMVMHGPGHDRASFGGIRAAALARARPPSQGGDERAYLEAFLDVRVAAMKRERAHSDTSRIDTAQRVFLRAGNLDLHGPLTWKVYGDTYHLP